MKIQLLKTIVIALLFSSQLHCHSPTFQSFLVKDLTIQLMDGSEWEICDADLSIAKTWRIGDPLTIRANRSWFSQYSYCIDNNSCPSTLRVNLTGAPSPFGPLSHWIIRIDHLSAHLYLEDGTIWCIHPQDEHFLADWDANDPIIVGHEDPLWSHSTKLLINVDRHEHVRADQYSHRNSRIGVKHN